MSLVTADALPAKPLDALRELARSEAELDDLRWQQIAAARDAGYTWEQIGEGLGMTCQSAWEYFGRRARERLTENVAKDADLSEDDVMTLAVEEVKAAR